MASFQEFLLSMSMYASLLPHGLVSRDGIIEHHGVQGFSHT